MDYEEWIEKYPQGSCYLSCEKAFNAGQKSTCVRANCGAFSYEAGRDTQREEDALICWEYARGLRPSDETGTLMDQAADAIRAKK